MTFVFLLFRITVCRMMKAKKSEGAAMREYELNYPVYTLDKKQLLPAGTTLTPGVMEELRETGRNTGAETARMMDYGSIRNDILEYLSRPPYSLICTGPARTLTLLKIMHKVSLPLPLLEGLTYFKKNEPYTYRHMLVVFAISSLLIWELFKEKQDLLMEAAALPVHDIGKICVPLDILGKNKPLTPGEREILDFHTLAGYVLLTHYMFDSDGLAARVARDHHTGNNGSRSHRGLSFEELMVEVVMVSDIYDALLSPRPYRPVALDNRTALEDICLRGEKGKIDWNVIKALIAVNREENPPYMGCAVSGERRGTPPADNIYAGVTFH